MKKYLIITLALFVVAGCSQDSDPVAPAADVAGPAIGSDEKAGGGGAPVAPECGYLLSPEGLQAFIDLAKAACNPQNSNVTGSNRHRVWVGGGVIVNDESYSMRWQQVDGDLLKTYYLRDWCLLGETHGFDAEGDIEVTPEMIQANADMLHVALLPENRATMIFDPYDRPGVSIYCESWVNGSYHVYFDYIGTAGARRAFTMRLVVTENFIPTVLPTDPR
ncbi:MAG: membrane lipoprotein lipid attachment site-containing protein [Krumholzibacteria bacterium]|nr:membrane lipoprotein lipid attachment site-containing protein [Candidatus Krumholzibacteria bacterium]